MAISIGLELAPSVIHAVALERKPPAPVTLLAAHELPCDTSNPEALTQALTQLRGMLRVTTPVVLGIPSTAALLTTVHPLVASPRHARLGVQFELQQQLPFELRETVWHYHWLSNGTESVPQGRSRFKVQGSRQPRAWRAVVAAMRSSLLEERLACCRRAGLPVRAVTLSGLATLNAWQAGIPTAGAEASGVMLLRCLDEQTAEWVVRTPEGLQVVPVSGPSAEAFRQELAASYEALGAQGAAGASPLWVAAPPTVRRQVEEALGGRAGGAAQAVDLSRVVRSGSGAWEHPERSVAAVGLALQGLGIARLPINLLSNSLEQAQVRRVNRIAAITSVCCAGLVVGLGLTGMLQARGSRLSILRSLERQERQYQELRPEVRAAIQRQQHTERRILRLEGLLGEAAALTQLLAQIADGLPDEVWLTLLEGAKGERVTGTLEGRAKSFQDVTRLLDRLKNIPGMQTVKPLATTIVADEASGKELIAFTVQVEQALSREKD